MPSPDVATYVGLELVPDVDAQTLLTTALVNASLSFPDWTPREGNTEVVVLEEVAAMAEDTVYAINALPAGMTEVLLRLFGQSRDLGAPPSAVITVTVVDDTGYTIPAGTTVRLTLGDNVDPIDLLTEAPIVIAPGSLTGTGTASGSDPTIAANGQPAGTVLELLDAIPYVETVTLAAAAYGGRVPEDGFAFLDRSVSLLGRLTNTLVRPVDVEAYVASATAAVTRVKALDLYNPGAGAPGTAPGYVTVAVAGAGGSSVGGATLSLLAGQLRSRMHAGLIVNVIDADVATVDVTVTVLRYPTAVDAAVVAAVTAILSTYLDPDSWDYTNVVRVNEVIATADRAAGVDTVLDVTLGLTGDPQQPSDLALGGYAPLAKLGTVTVIVQAP